MATRGALETAKAAISAVMSPHAGLCQPFLTLAPLDGASVSVLAGSTGQSTICSSDATAARLDELQFDLGEGPCWEALATRRPVLAAKIGTTRYPAWPVFADAVRADQLGANVGSIYAFPLVVGSLDIGAIDLYSLRPTELTSTQVSNVSELAGLAAWQVLRRILASEGSDADDSEASTGRSRREVHQATGMILAQLDISAADAALLLRAHAYSTGRSVRDVANDVVARRVDFSGPES